MQLLSACARGCVAIAVLLAASGALARPPDFPAPKGAQVSQVAQDMTILGRTMSVRAFTTDQNVDEVVEFYKGLWAEPPSKGAPGYAYEPDAIAPWHLVTRVEDGYVMTVQVMEHQDKGAFGFLALGLLPEPGEPPAPPPDPPALKDSQVLSNIHSSDVGQNGQTAMIANRKSVASNVSFYRQYYQDWRKDLDREVARGKMHALSFTRGRRQVVITIEGNRDGSRIVVNSVKHDLL